jgi:hypothetical protein
MNAFDRPVPTLAQQTQYMADAVNASGRGWRPGDPGDRPQFPEQNRPVDRHPLAFGMTKWGPLPGTRDAYLLWDGPGAGLYYHAADPDKPGQAAAGRRVRHQSANGEYATVKAAEAAVFALVAVYREQEAAEAARGVQLELFAAEACHD